MWLHYIHATRPLHRARLDILEIRLPNPADKYPAPAGFKIVSGGQTGADQAGLDWAIANGIVHGGWCPKGRKSETGPIDARYHLAETPGSGYLERNEWNVRDSDATVVFTLLEKLDGGSKKTADFAASSEKPWMHFHPRVHPKYLARFLSRHEVGTLNVAGKRESSAPGIAKLVADTLGSAVDTSLAAVESPR